MITKEQIINRLAEYGIHIKPEDIRFDYAKDELRNVFINYLPEHRDDFHQFIANQIGIIPGCYLQRVYNPSINKEDRRPEHELLYEIKQSRGRVRKRELAEVEEYTLYGFISPEGDFYECDYAQHNYLQPDLFEDGQFIHMFDEYEAAGLSGWMKLTGSMWTKCEFTFNFKPKIYRGSKHDAIKLNFTLTEKQLEFIFKYAKARGQDEVNFNYSDVKLINLVDKIKEYYE